MNIANINSKDLVSSWVNLNIPFCNRFCLIIMYNHDDPMMWKRFPHYYLLPSLQWLHNERDDVSSPSSRLFTQPFVQAQIKENIKALRHRPSVREIHRWPVNSPQRASNAEIVSIWWRHYVKRETTDHRRIPRQSEWFCNLLNKLLNKRLSRYALTSLYCGHYVVSHTLQGYSAR